MRSSVIIATSTVVMLRYLEIFLYSVALQLITQGSAHTSSACETADMLSATNEIDKLIGSTTAIHLNRADASAAGSHNSSTPVVIGIAGGSGSG